MSPRTKRTLRTVIQVAIGVASAVPALVAGLPLGEAGVQAVVIAGVVTHKFHLIEAIPGFPEFLKVPE